MKQLVFALLFSVAILITIAGEANADDQADIVALYAKLQNAMKAQSSPQVLALLAPGFSYKDRKGSVLNGKQFADQINVQKSGVAVKEVKFKVTETVITGKTAKVKDEFSWAMEMAMVGKDGKPGPKGMHHTMTSTGVVENDLEKTAQGWRFLTLNTVDGKMTLDGKLVVHRDSQPPPANGSK